MNSAPDNPDVVDFDVQHTNTRQLDQLMAQFDNPGGISQQDAYLALDKLISVVRQAFPVSQQASGAGSLAGVSLVEKKSFLVFKNNKYTTISTDDIAYIYIRNGAATIVTYKEQQFSQDRSLDQIQNLLSSKEFFRVNRQYLISFRAIKEVEHYSARKLLVNLMIPSPEQLLIAKEKAQAFLHWLDCR